MRKIHSPILKEGGSSIIIMGGEQRNIQEWKMITICHQTIPLSRDNGRRPRGTHLLLITERMQTTVPPSPQGPDRLWIMMMLLLLLLFRPLHTVVHWHIIPPPLSLLQPTKNFQQFIMNFQCKHQYHHHRKRVERRIGRRMTMKRLQVLLLLLLVTITTNIPHPKHLLAMI